MKFEKVKKRSKGEDKKEKEKCKKNKW
jgi:hypothetical protein